MNNIVSIITPSFNRADLVSETAESIFSQSYPHWEWMIVDDGSTDNSWEVLQDLAARDSRVKIYKRDRGPKGACVCRNIAIEKSTGDYLIFLDTDDLMAPFCLEQRVQAMKENPEADFAIFPMLLFKKDRDDLNQLWNVDKELDELFRVLIGDPICQGTGTLWKKSSFYEMGMWKEDLMIWQDIELHIRAFLWPMKYVKRMDLQPDVYLRVTDNSLSRGGFYSTPKVKSRFEVFQYAVETIAQKNRLPQYHKALRYMGVDLFIGMIYSRNLAMIPSIISVLSKHGLISNEERRTMKFFLRLHQLRINKITPIDKYFYDKISPWAKQPVQKETLASSPVEVALQ